MNRRDIPIPVSAVAIPAHPARPPNLFRRCPKHARAASITSFLKRISDILGMILLLCLLAACSSLPEIRPAGPDVQPRLRERCRAVFPADPRQFVHAIEARLPDDTRQQIVGVVTLDPGTGFISCVILTLEGFVLFDARQGQTLTVNRAVPPFDSPEFAARMMADIRLVFAPPGGVLTAAGVFRNGLSGCRWQDADGLTVEVLLNDPQGWAVRQYDAADGLSGEVRAYALNPDGVPEKIELSRRRFPGYTLRMTLLQTERLLQDDERLR